MKRFIRPALLCISFAACPPTMADNPSELSSVREFQETVIAGRQYSSASSAMTEASYALTMIGADDLAVGATLLSAAANLKSLFGTSDSQQGEVIRQIDALRQQQAEIIRLLGRVLDVLAQLDVVVERVVRDKLIELLTNQINSAITEHHETRRTLVRDPRYQEAKARFTIVWNDLVKLGRTLTGYGPAVFHTVGTNMFFEADAARRIGRPVAEQIEKLETYRLYFNDVLDPGKKGSVGASRAYLMALIEKADAVLTAADQALERGRNFDRGEWCSEWGGCEDRGGSTRSCYRRVLIVNGNRASRYSVSKRDDFVRNEGRCYGRAGGPRERYLTVADVIRPASPAAGNLPMLPSPGGGSIEEQADFWNRTRAVLDEAQKQLPAIEQDYQAAVLFLEEVQRRIREFGG